MLTSAVVVAVSAATIEPRGWTGLGLTAVMLLIVNSLLLLSRHVPTAFVSGRLRLGLLWSAAIASAALVAVSSGGSPYLFAFFVAGHAGYRLPVARAVPVAVACSLFNGGVLLLHVGPGHHLTPWAVGAASGLSVLLGMASSSRQAALDAALAAAEFSAQAASAAERAAQAEARSAVLAERGRIARDVHDVLAHSLAGISMQLELADALLEAGRLEPAREATRRAQSLAKESLVESQRTVSALREDALPLLETLRPMLRSSGHSESLVVTGQERPLDTRSTQALLRIAQEGLTNAARHAPDARVTLTVAYQPDNVCLELVNGPAADPTVTGAVSTRGSAEGSGMGLVGIRERVALLGGIAAIGPVTEGPDDGGWRVQAIIPA
ncbi:MAG: hypothetical protein JWM76_3038 [Pseudonocardiales bacterium]|nr:hypothetical protein [Pseudonocardiales bacterium]